MTTTSAINGHRPSPTPPTWQPRWAPGRVIAFMAALFLLLGAAGSVTAAAWLDHVKDRHRDGDYVTSDTRELQTSGHALVVDELDLDGLNGDWLLGRARVRATSADPDGSVFVGIAEKDDAAEYLRGVGYADVREVDDPDYDEHDGGSPAIAPADSDIWVAQASGPGEQSVHWTPDEGDWTVVIMNTDGSGDVDVRADVGATLPVLGHVIRTLQFVGGAFALIALALLGGLVLRRDQRG